MFAIAGHEISFAELCTFIVAVGGFLISLGYFKSQFDSLREDYAKTAASLQTQHKELRDDLEARDMKLGAELRMASEANATWREGAAGRFATRDELHNSNGIAKAIREVGDRVVDLARRG